MEEHKNIIKSKCRVCGRKAGTRRHDPVKVVLSGVYSISVETESDEIFPSSVCHSCYSVLKRAADSNDSRPVLRIPTWLPHSDPCQLCSEGSQGGRPRKLKRGRPSDSDSTCVARKVMHTVNEIHSTTPEYAPFPLQKSLFLPSPFLEYLVCKSCDCIPSSPVELSTCHHFLCMSCVKSGCNTGSITCPCNDLTLGSDELCTPTDLALDVMGSLLVR